MRGLAFFALIIRSVAFAQCEYTTNEIDAFTKELRVETKAGFFPGDGSGLHFRFHRHGDQYSMDIIFAGYAYTNLVATEGSTVLLKWAGDSISELRSTSTVATEAYLALGVTSYSIRVPFNLTREECQRMATDKLTAVRMHFTDGFKDVIWEERKDKKVAKVRGAARCLLEAVAPN